MRARGDRHAAAARARSGASLFGKTLETVLAERPVPRDHRVRARKLCAADERSPSAARRIAPATLILLQRDDPDRDRAGGHGDRGGRRARLGVGSILGVLFVAAGGARLYLLARSLMRARRRSTSAGTSPGCASSAAACRRSAAALGSPALFAIVYASVASAIYFSLGVVADHALGLTPVVFLSAACSSS